MEEFQDRLQEGEQPVAGGWRTLSAFNALPLKRPGAEALDDIMDLREEVKKAKTKQKDKKARSEL